MVNINMTDISNKAANLRPSVSVRIARSLFDMRSTIEELLAECPSDARLWWHRQPERHARGRVLGFIRIRPVRGAGRDTDSWHGFDGGYTSLPFQRGVIFGPVMAGIAAIYLVRLGRCHFGTWIQTVYPIICISFAAMYCRYVLGAISKGKRSNLNA